MGFTFYPLKVSSRLFEWFSTIIMLGMALIVAMDPRSLAKGGFYLMAHVGITATVLFILFFLFGLLRLAALIANGYARPWGPLVRSVTALVAAVVWSQMAFSLVTWSLQQEYLSIGVPVYAAMTLGELVSTYRARRDANVPVH